VNGIHPLFDIKVDSEFALGEGMLTIIICEGGAAEFTRENKR
jgi:hypothetical protein